MSRIAVSTFLLEHFFRCLVFLLTCLAPYFAMAQDAPLVGHWSGRYGLCNGAFVDVELDIGLPNYNATGYSGFLTAKTASATGTAKARIAYEDFDPFQTVIGLRDWQGLPEDMQASDFYAARSKGGTGISTTEEKSCKTLSLSKAPWPEMSEVDRKALFNRGLNGKWQAEMACDQVGEVAIDVAFRMDPVSGALQAEMALSPLTQNDRVPRARFVSRVDALPDGRLRLLPVLHMSEPADYSPPPPTLAIALSNDGQELEGEQVGLYDECGPVAGWKIEDGPPPVVLSDDEISAANNFALSLSGPWYGRVQCTDGAYVTWLTLEQTGDGIFIGKQKAKGRGKAPGFEIHTLSGRVDPIGPALDLNPLELLGGGTDGFSLLPTRLWPSGEEGMLAAEINRAGCDEAIYRQYPVPDVAVMTQPGPSQTTIFQRDTRRPNRLRVAKPETACAAYEDWMAQAGTDAFIGTVVRAGSEHYGRLPMLLQDSQFVPFFGLPYDELAGSDQVEVELGRLGMTCRKQFQAQGGLPPEFNRFNSFLKVAMQVDPNDPLRLMVEDLALPDGSLDMFREYLAALPDTKMGLNALDRLPPDIAALRDRMTTAERAVGDDLIETRRVEIREAIVDGYVAELSREEADKARIVELEREAATLPRPLVDKLEAALNAAKARRFDLQERQAKAQAQAKRSQVTLDANRIVDEMYSKAFGTDPMARIKKLAELMGNGMTRDEAIAALNSPENLAQEETERRERVGWIYAPEPLYAQMRNPYYLSMLYTGQMHMTSPNVYFAVAYWYLVLSGSAYAKCMPDAAKYEKTTVYTQYERNGFLPPVVTNQSETSQMVTINRRFADVFPVLYRAITQQDGSNPRYIFDFANKGRFMPTVGVKPTQLTDYSREDLIHDIGVILASEPCDSEIHKRFENAIDPILDELRNFKPGLGALKR
ncbi:hypothetical protein [Acuticoccus mangrovi]|uniref:Uncharacterized protein n=1 Tax=Acuticoccus mangrovi TaxID=2796142 RepID=A0A934III5_9HYPH|nr:hypothetical protein [Acuticoccus mangrovi]MBJ3777334.1 hypothetical protein [Acuticoccus mangrovi]